MSQLTLPYAELKPAAPQRVLREHFNRSAVETYKIKLNLINEREGFNQRKVYENIPDLADQILEHGLTDPFWLSIEPDGKAWLIRGHRRLRAFKLLIENELLPEDVEVEFRPVKMTEMEMFLDQEISNSGEKMKPVERAGIAFGLKYNFGEELSNEVIAKKMGISRQNVDNLIKIAQANDVIKDQMIKQELTMKDALALIDNERKLKRQADSEEKKHAQSSSKVAPDKKDINADELSALHELENKVLVEGEDDLPFDENIEEDEEVRTTTNISGEIKSSNKPLKLVGNSIADKKAAKDDDRMPKFDESRDEIKWINNVIKLLDKIEVIAEKIPNKQTSKDITDILGWQRKDALEIRLWISKNKPQNKAR